MLGLVGDVTDLSPGWESVQVEEANSPCIDGHHHYHQANDIDPQASFHLQDTNQHSLVTQEAVAQIPEHSPPSPASPKPCGDVITAHLLGPDLFRSLLGVFSCCLGWHRTVEGQGGLGVAAGP